MSSATDSVIVRLPADKKTLDALEQMEKTCFSCPWSRNSLAAALIREGYDTLGLLLGDTLVGYAVISTVFEDCDLQNLAVAPPYRRAGYGKALLNACLTRAEERGAQRVFLEVRRGNTAAIALYSSAGFAPYGVRKNYYTHPVEDAVLMAKII